uniref:NADH dehydrogenase subunit 6 n=1 Tax=Hemidactylus mandebensis TaxID=1643449 RepID=UPI0021B68520|nr:NADH dehydrogenase subunit 6 [Hemidactylus mandebensis]UVW80923.1 NADH dehydrogenase subunit 6 [Hemidactylus mandebensis]
MSYLLFFMGLCYLVGLVGVAANPAPYFGVVGLVVGVVGGCGLLVGLGGSFVGLILFLIYLGGMLVVFAYSVALAADPHPAGWADSGVLGYVFVYSFLVVMVVVVLGEVVGVAGIGTGVGGGMCGVRLDFGGVGVLFSGGGWLLMLCVLGLLLALGAILELVRGHSRGSLRVP